MDIQKRVERIINEAEYLLQRECTIRECAKQFGVSKTTVHTDMQERLKGIDKRMHRQVYALLRNNWKERTIRGGRGTKDRYTGHKRLNGKFV